MLLESALCGARIGDVAQPDFEQLLLMVEPPGGAGGRRARVLRVSHQPHRCVIHLSDMDMPKVARPLPRFMQLARARLRGGVIRGCFQYNDQRIVRMAIETRWTAAASVDAAVERGGQYLSDRWQRCDHRLLLSSAAGGRDQRRQSAIAVSGQVRRRRRRKWQGRWRRRKWQGRWRRRKWQGRRQK